MALGEWISVPTSQKRSSRQAGHRLAEISRSHFRPWLFLAPAWLPVDDYSGVTPGFLACQIQRERQQGQTQHRSLAGTILAGYGDLGMFSPGEKRAPGTGR